MRKPYTSDLSDEQWALIEPLIPPPRSGGYTRTMDMRELVNAVLYVTKNGCQWRDLPHDFAPHWNTVYAYFEAWSGDGTWQRIYEALHRRSRKAQGRERRRPPPPSTANRSRRPRPGASAATTGPRSSSGASATSAWTPRGCRSACA